MTELSDDKPERAEQAAAWHVRLRATDASDDDFVRFEQWIADPANREAYDRLDRLWAELDVQAPALTAALKPEHVDAGVSRGKPARLSRRVLLWGGLSAAAALTGFVVLHHTQTRWSSFAAARDQTKIVRLADGSVITLNRGSAMRVALQDSERRVELQGEASFDVAHNPAKPFVVAAGNEEVRVLGTEFNVLQRGDQTIVTVRRGAVQVRSGDVSHTVPKGRQAVCRAGAIEVHDVNSDDAFAWQTGRLIYNAARLNEVVADLNRYFETPVRVADERTGALRFSGVLVLDGEEQVLARLDAFLPIVIDRDEQGVLIRSNPS